MFSVWFVSTKMRVIHVRGSCESRMCKCFLFNVLHLKDNCRILSISVVHTMAGKAEAVAWALIGMDVLFISFFLSAGASHTSWLADTTANFSAEHKFNTFYSFAPWPEQCSPGCGTQYFFICLSVSLSLLFSSHMSSLLLFVSVLSEPPFAWLLSWNRMTKLVLSQTPLHYTQ